MDFCFTEDQLLFKDSMRDVLLKECSPEVIRKTWETREPPQQLWPLLAEMGVSGLMIAESYGGLGMSETDLVSILEETGRAALPLPVVEANLIAPTLIQSCPDTNLQNKWLPLMGQGKARAAVHLGSQTYALNTKDCDFLLIEHDKTIHLLKPGQWEDEAQPSVDHSRQLNKIKWTPVEDTIILQGSQAELLLNRAFNHGAMGTSAQLLGLTQNLIDVTVEYAKARTQFGKAIGSFQAIKHRLAESLMKLEFARPVVYRAAASMAEEHPETDTHVSMAKYYANQASYFAAKAALQVHGAIGYSFEYDLHLWMKRVWALNATWGDTNWHRHRVGQNIL